MTKWERVTSIEIRPATTADATEIVRLISANAALHGWQKKVEATPASVRRDGIGKEALFRVLLAEAGGAAIGFVQYYFIYHPWRATRGVFVTDLYLDEGARRRGVGRQLMAAVAHQAEIAGCSDVDLRLQKDNHSARFFYEGLGMQVTDETFYCRLEGEALSTLAAEAR